MSESFYNVKEVAERLGVRVQVVYEAINSGELRAVRLSQRNTRVAESDLKKYLEEKAVE